MWYKNGCSNFSEEKRRHLSVLAAGEKSAMVYNDAEDGRLRCSCNFMQVIFLYGGVSDGLMIKGNEVVADIVTKAFWFLDANCRTHAVGKLEAGARREQARTRVSPDFPLPYLHLPNK